MVCVCVCMRYIPAAISHAVLSIHRQESLEIVVLPSLSLYTCTFNINCSLWLLPLVHVRSRGRVIVLSVGRSVCLFVCLFVCTKSGL